MQKKKVVKKAVKKSVKPSEEPGKRGRPPVEFRKKSFHLLLDPRYIKHFKKKASEMNVQPQDLARLALQTMIPDPFNPATASDFTKLLKRVNAK